MVSSIGKAHNKEIEAQAIQQPTSTARGLIVTTSTGSIDLY